MDKFSRNAKISVNKFDKLKGIDSVLITETHTL